MLQKFNLFILEKNFFILEIKNNLKKSGIYIFYFFIRYIFCLNT